MTTQPYSFDGTDGAGNPAVYRIDQNYAGNTVPFRDQYGRISVGAPELQAHAVDFKTFSDATVPDFYHSLSASRPTDGSLVESLSGHAIRIYDGTTVPYRGDYLVMQAYGQCLSSRASMKIKVAGAEPAEVTISANNDIGLMGFQGGYRLTAGSVSASAQAIRSDGSVIAEIVHPYPGGQKVLGDLIEVTLQVTDGVMMAKFDGSVHVVEDAEISPVASMSYVTRTGPEVDILEVRHGGVPNWDWF